MSSRRPLSSQSQTEVGGKETREVIDGRALDILHEMSTLLNTGLDRKQLMCAVTLLEGGTNPTALAGVIQQLRVTAAERKNSN